jgi:hypothetical protein
MLPSGIAVTFNHKGSTQGTIAGLPFGTPDRDDTWTISGTNPQISAHWSQIGGAILSAALAGTDTLVGGIESLFKDLINQLLQQLGKAAVAAVVAVAA